MVAATGLTDSGPSPDLFRLLLDARTAFSYPSPPTRQPVATWATTTRTATALALLPPQEQDRVRRFIFPKDAALSLASFLLKHIAILRTHPSLSWNNSVISQERTTNNGKPYYAAGDVEFNVSHHGEAAVLIGTSRPGVNVGIDLVCVDMLKDMKTVGESGWDKWCSTYKDVFSDGELQTMKQSLVVRAGARPTTQEIVKGLRCFYAHWGLKEAYAKMTGEALLADWLQKLEFRQVNPPTPASKEDTAQNPWAWGERTTPTASMSGQNIDGVQLELWALGEHYMVATAVRGKISLPPFEQVDVERDIMPLTRR
jgi:4'-phosphopantetheinyl transferase